MTAPPLALTAPGLCPALTRALRELAPGMRALPGVDGPPRRPIRNAASLDGLRAWLGGEAARPSKRVSEPSASAPRLDTGPPPRGAWVIVPGLAPWEGTLPRRLARRPDLRVMALAGWPSSWDWPEYAAPRAAANARPALAAMLRAASLVVAPEAISAARFGVGRGGPTVVVEPEPSPLAGMPAADGARLPPVPYLVAPGSIEARGNSLLLLQIWREAAMRGERLPRLVLAGERGRQIEDIAPLLDWTDVLRPQVAEAPRLPPSAIRALIEGATAVLAPDFVDAPLALLRDAAALGVPVLAANRPETRGLGFAGLLDPLDGPGWRDAIRAVAAMPRGPRLASPLPDWPGYAARLLEHAARLDAGLPPA